MEERKRPCGLWSHGLAGLALMLGLAGAAHAHDGHDHRHHDAHVHGRGDLNLAVDGSRLLITLEAPAVNFLGFEHAPRDAEERAAVSALKTRLRQIDGLFAINDAARCRLDEATVTATGLDGEADQGDDGHHAEVAVAYKLTCDAMSALESVDVGLFERYPGFDEIAAVYLVADRQSARTLRPGDALLTLR